MGERREFYGLVAGHAFNSGTAICWAILIFFAMLMYLWQGFLDAMIERDNEWRRGRLRNFEREIERNGRGNSSAAPVLRSSSQGPHQEP